jgi:hypothetical protein
MFTIEVTREFRDRCEELALKSNVPEIRARLWKLYDKYQQDLEKLEASASALSVPSEDLITD